MPLGIWNLFAPPGPVKMLHGGKRGKAKRRTANKSARTQRKRTR